MKKYLSFSLGLVVVLGGFFVANTTRALDLPPPAVIINEFVPYGDTEWVELLNTTNDDIPLTDWYLVDTADHVKLLTSLGSIPAHGIVVYEYDASVTGWLNNDADTITLLDNNNTPIHSTSYATPPGAGQSAALGSDYTTWSPGTPTKGWFNDAGTGGQTAPLLSTIDTALYAGGEGVVTNIGELTNPSDTPDSETGVDSTTALYFEKVGKGKIVFTTSLNLSDQATVAVIQSLGTAMEITDGHVKFDSTTAAAMNATGAKIYMYGLDFDSEPNIIVRDDNGDIIDPEDDNYPDITDISYEAGTLVFDTSHFTEFDAEDETPACSDTSFDSFSLGSVNGQDGWSVAGSYDQAVVDNTYGYSSFGCKSLRLSNAVTSGSFGDQTFSPSNSNEAGEIDSTNGDMSGGTRQNHFEAQFDFASTQSTQQSGLFISVSPDRGDGSRMSYLGFSDEAEGIDVIFYDTPGTDNPANFSPTTVASGLSRTTAHTAKFVIDYVDGPSNDIVKIYIDEVLVHTGTTWENYFRFDTEASAEPTPRTTDDLLFRVGGSAAPETDGSGFLFDNINITSSTTDITSPTFGVHIGTTGTTGETTTIGITVNDNVSVASAEISFNDGESYTSMTETTSSLDRNDAQQRRYTFDKSIPSDSTANINYIVRALDGAGNSSTLEDMITVSDNDAPTISGEIDATDLSTIEVMFNEDLQNNEDGHHPQASDFIVYNGESYDGENSYEISNVSYSNKKITITLTNPIQAGDDPHLDVLETRSSIVDLADNYFNTGSEYDHKVYTAPVITEETTTTASVTTTSIVVTWTTDHLATSRVIYDTVSHSELGEAPNYGYANSTGTSDEEPMVTSHNITVSGLTANTNYFFRTVSHGSPEAVSGEFSRTTSSTSSGSGSSSSGSRARSNEQVLVVATGPTTGEVLGAEKFIFTQFMRLGSTDVTKKGEVTELQKFLNTAGYGILVVDGKFGPLTKIAVIKFQLANVLVGDGVVGPLTRAVLNK
ncbi:MAG: peptidoglycan-binding protein [Candidatus Paceibacterota bacterium]